MSNIREKFDEKDFLAKYSAASKFVAESSLYVDFLDAISDENYFNDIRDMNDKEQAPPIVTLVMNYGDMGKCKMTDYEKTSIGMCMSYVFRCILGYREAIEVKVDECDGVGGIKNASYFVK